MLQIYTFDAVPAIILYVTGMPQDTGGTYANPIDSHLFCCENDAGIMISVMKTVLQNFRAVSKFELHTRRI
jgi:hypothetical protein